MLDAAALGTAPTIRLEGEKSRDDGQHNEDCCANVKRCRCRCIGPGGYNRRDYTHDPIARHGDSISCPSVSAEEHLRGVCIESPVVNIEEASNQTRECKVLLFCFDGCVGEEERHGDQGTDAHGVFPPEHSGVAHDTSDYWPRNAADGSDCVIPPLLRGSLLVAQAMAFQVCS